MGRKLVDGRAAEALEDVLGLAELSGNIEPLEGRGLGHSMWVVTHPEIGRHLFRAQSVRRQGLEPRTR
jgi:hypothetical protein